MAEQKGVVVAEAMTIYHMPIYKKLKEMLNSGVLGKVNLITMNFGSFKEYDMNNRFFNPNLAGGAMLDIGVYALSFIRWFMDSRPSDGVGHAFTSFKAAEKRNDFVRERIHRDYGISESMGSSDTLCRVGRNTIDNCR